MKYITTLKESSDVLLRGDRCITNLRELYSTLLLKDTEEIKITPEFIDKYFTVSGLCDFVEQASIINDQCNVLVDSDLPLFVNERVDQLHFLKTREELMYALQMREHEIMETIQFLCEHYKSAQSENVAANNKIATLHLVNSQLEKSLISLQERYDDLMDTKNEYEMKLQSMIARINYSYSKDVESNSLSQIGGHRYDKILYIKEITRVHFVDTMIYYLQEILKIMYGVPCRLLVIEPFYAYKRCKLYPNCKPVYNLTKQDVFQSDIVMAGFQPRLTEAILRNPAHMNYLIVLDRGGYSVPHIYGKNIDVIYTVSSPADLDTLEIKADSKSIISYSDITLNIPYVEAFAMRSLEERMRIYSSMDVIQHLIEIIERK